MQGREVNPYYIYYCLPCAIMVESPVTKVYLVSQKTRHEPASNGNVA